ncbi:MAG: hypothetical protein WEC75_06005 [Dehalococcoidia bacterium]
MHEPDRSRYYRSVARAVGVPDFWIEDAVQDMTLAAWRSGRSGPLATRRRAIDAVRRYGPISRRGTQRPAALPLDPATAPHAPEPAIELIDALRAAWHALTPRQRQALRRRLACQPMTNRESVCASAARRRLRRALLPE